MQYEILRGDCISQMRAMPDNSFDSIVCDPPYELGFMGKSWDASGIAYSVEMWAEALRILKPGGHLLAFSGSRTYHRMTCAIEDAGFEVRDQIMWVYGSGFPKSMNVAKAIDATVLTGSSSFSAMADVEDSKGIALAKEDDSFIAYGAEGSRQGKLRHGARREKSDPITDAARQWEGWGTALKPAHEPICVARKPLAKGATVAANVLQHGTGALNIDGCRVAGESTARHTFKVMSSKGAEGGALGNQEHEYATRDAAYSTGSDAGRWPANLIHSGDPEVVACFPIENGKSAARFFMECKGGYNDVCPDLNPPPFDALTAALNSSLPSQAVVSVLAHAASSALPEGLLCSGLSPEPSTTATATDLRLLCESVTQAIQSIERKFWLESRPAKLTLTFNLASAAAQLEPTGTTTITISHWRSDGSAEPVTFNITRPNLEAGAKGSALSTGNSRLIYCAKASKSDRGPNNTHPTVKPLALMQYLCRLVTPPGGRILDPFAGSGSTIVAALREGFIATGIELLDDHADIIEGRLDHELYGDLL